MTLRDQLKRDEGLRLTPYRDQFGWLTIGYGRNLDARGITNEEAEFLLDGDLSIVEAAVRIRLPWSVVIGEPRHAVLVGMAFNMGIGGMLGFKKLLKAAEEQDWELAARELLDSKLHQQTPERAQRWAEQLRTGDWV